MTAWTGLHGLRHRTAGAHRLGLIGWGSSAGAHRRGQHTGFAMPGSGRAEAWALDANVDTGAGAGAEAWTLDADTKAGTAEEVGTFDADADTGAGGDAEDWTFCAGAVDNNIGAGARLGAGAEAHNAEVADVVVRKLPD